MGDEPKPERLDRVRHELAPFGLTFVRAAEQDRFDLVDANTREP
jgi:hypothetical protein